MLNFIFPLWYSNKSHKPEISLLNEMNKINDDKNYKWKETFVAVNFLSLIDYDAI